MSVCVQLRFMWLKSVLLSIGSTELRSMSIMMQFCTDCITTRLTSAELGLGSFELSLMSVDLRPVSTVTEFCSVECRAVALIESTAVLIWSRWSPGSTSFNLHKRKSAHYICPRKMFDPHDKLHPMSMFFFQFSTKRNPLNQLNKKIQFNWQFDQPIKYFVFTLNHFKLHFVKWLSLGFILSNNINDRLISIIFMKKELQLQTFITLTLTNCLFKILILT